MEALMGARGRGAKPKAKKNMGRPRNQGNPLVIEALRPLLTLAISRMREILEDDEADRRHHVRVAQVLIEALNKPPDEQEEPDREIVVKMQKEWRAPAA